MDKLKPCPFCGGKVHMWKMEQTLSPKIGKIIECDSCGVRFHFHWASVYEQAAFHWNRRAEWSEDDEKWYTYNWKKHKCNRGAKEEGRAQDHFYRDCPIGINIEEDAERSEDE